MYMPSIIYTFQLQLARISKLLSPSPHAPGPKKPELDSNHGR